MFLRARLQDRPALLLADFWQPFSRAIEELPAG